MDAQVIKLDSAHAARRDLARQSRVATALLAGASLVILACGIVAAVLWLVWMLAEVIP